MWRLSIALAIVIAPTGTERPTTMKSLTFLTRDGCVNTPDMLNNVDDALKELGWPTDYQYIDLDATQIERRNHDGLRWHDDRWRRARII